jgi:branched-chain amino acid aminotransferase
MVRRQTGARKGSVQRTEKIWHNGSLVPWDEARVHILTHALLDPSSNPVEMSVAVWPWGAYLGEEALEHGVRCGVSSFRRIGPNTLPPAAKASGQYINSVLAKLECNRSGYDEAILLNEAGYVADGTGENVFVVKDGVAYTPPTTASCLPGITRDTVIRILRALGHEVREVELVRTDLYFGDEVFLCGTAAEVTPVASVDDHSTGGRGPITRTVQETFFAIVGGRDERFGELLDYAPAPAVLE